MVATEQIQTFENHRAQDRGLVAMAVVVLVAALLAVYAINTWGDPLAAILLTVAVLLAAAAQLALLLKVRRYALTVQDRVIRIEMQARLQRVLQKELYERSKALTLRQLIALRFAADRELPEIIEKVLAEKIVEPDRIKRMIKHWQPDHLRV